MSHTQKTKDVLETQRVFEEALLAAKNGDTKLLGHLLETRCINIDQMNRNGKTLLFQAVENKHLGTVKLLVSYGANVNILAQYDGIIPLDKAIKYGYHLGRYGMSPIAKAVELGYFDIAKFLLNNGADINAVNIFGKSILYLVSKGGCLKFVRLLLRSRVKIDQPRTYLETPLYIAIYNNHLGIVKCLMDHNADINGTDKDKWTTPLYEAARCGHLDIVKWLLEKHCGSCINETNHYGRTPLFAAAKNGRLGVVKFLLDFGADVDKEDKIGKTPLYAAVEYGCIDGILQMLLDFGADMNKKNKKGISPYGIGGYDGWGMGSFFQKHKEKIEKQMCILREYSDLGIWINDPDLVKLVPKQFSYQAKTLACLWNVIPKKSVESKFHPTEINSYISNKLEINSRPFENVRISILPLELFHELLVELWDQYSLEKN